MGRFSQNGLVAPHAGSEPGYLGGTYWHLNGEYGINADEVWSRYTGDGVLVGFMDEGFDLTDRDLSENFRSDLSYDYHNSDSTIGEEGGGHGIGVANIGIGAGNNGGSLGVAYDAEWAAYEVSFEVSRNFSQAFRDGAENSDVFNNSWGYVGSYTSGLSGSIDLGLTSGRDGLGTVIVFSAGNAGGTGVSSSTSGMNAHIGTIVVGATTSGGYQWSNSSTGANLLVSAPGSQVTYNYDNGAYNSANGTSYAAPIVSGVVALMLEANEDLGWRDVQEILAVTSRVTDSGAESWVSNGAKNWNGGSMSFSNEFGFGLVDAQAAVNLAKSWFKQSTSDNMDSFSATASGPNMNLSGNLTIDQVTLHVQATYSDWSNVVIELRSPDGTVSELVNSENHVRSTVAFTFESNAFWGEDSSGSWSISFRDATTGSLVAANLTSATLTAYGDADTSDDTYYLTSEFADLVAQDSSRATISDTDGGVDVVNLAASTRSNQVDLSGNNQSMFEGVEFTLSNPSVFEHAVTGRGNDTLWGNSLGNTFFTGSGNDRAYGYDGDDYFVTGFGADIVFAGRGDDRIVTQQGDDSVYGEGGDDRILTSSGEDYIEGGAGNDIIISGGEDDTALGGDGNDVILAGSGNDDIDGGAGNDRIWGGAGTDDLKGGAGDDNIDGGAGNDVLQGGAGNDRLNGGAGADVMTGGDGSDVYLVDSVGDQVIETQVGVDDIVFIHASGAFEFSDFIETARLFEGAGGASLTMGSGRNSLFGNSSSNMLDGGAGDDFLDGGAGSDRLIGGNGADVFIFRDLAGGVDEIADFQNGVNSIGIENLLTLSAGAGARSAGAISGGYAYGIQNGTDVDIFIDDAAFAGSASGDRHFTTIENMSVSLLSDDDFAFV